VWKDLSLWYYYLLLRNLTDTQNKKEAVQMNDTMSTLNNAKAYSTHRCLEYKKK